MSKTLLFVALALLVAVAFASTVEQSNEMSTEIDIDSTIAEMATVADSQAELLSMQTEAAKKGKKSTNGVQRLVKMLRKVIRRTRRSLRAAAKNRAAQNKECKRVFKTAKAKLPIAKAAIATMKTKLQLAQNAITRSKNEVSAFQKKVADAVSEGKRFDSLQVTRRGEHTINVNRLSSANDESQALIALLESIKGNLKANGLAEISSELMDAAHAHAAQEAMLLAIAAAAEKATRQGLNKKGMNEVHDMIDLLIANLKKDVAANAASIKQMSASATDLVADLAKSADSARANAKSYLKSQGDASAAGDKAAKDVLAFTVRIKALEAKVANTIKRVATTKKRCAASKRRFVGKKARALKKIRVLKAIIKQLKSTKLSAAMIAKIAGLKLDKAVWTKGAWGACSTKCGLGVQTRVVKCSGKYCKGRKPSAKKSCTTGACKVACVVSPWTHFSKCKGGVQQRTRKVLVRASNGGKACPSTAGLIHKRGCSGESRGNRKKVAEFAKKTAEIKKAIAANKVEVKKATAVVKNLLSDVKKAESEAAFLEVKAKLEAEAKRLAALKNKEGALLTDKFDSKQQGWEFTPAGVAANKFCTSKGLTGTSHMGCMHDIQLSGDKQAAAQSALQNQKIAAAQLAAAPRACQVSAWSAFGACSTRCGGGKQTRTRTVTAQAANGGAACPALVDSQSCNTQACPVDCVLSAWSAWSACSKPCAGGTQTQTRSITKNAANGGQSCPTTTSQSQACNTQACPPPPAPPARAQAASAACTKNSCPKPPTIPRNTQNAPARWCSSVGDPHTTNFNGDYFHMQLPQIVTFAKTDDGLFEVQVYQDGSTGPGTPSYVREVKIRYGNQIYNENFNRDGFRVTGNGQVSIQVPGAYQSKMLGACGGNQAAPAANNFKDQSGKVVDVHWKRGEWYWGIFGYGGGNTGVSKFEKAWKPTMDDCLFSAARCASNLASNAQSGVMGRICTPWGCVDMRQWQ